VKIKYKKQLFLLLLSLLPLLLFAEHVHWMGSYDAALQKAVAEHKPLLLLVVKKSDPNSGKILKDFFMNRPYIEKINRDMVAVIVAYEGRESYPVEMYYTTQFPALFFVDAQRELFMHKPLYVGEITEEILEKYLEVP